MVKTSSSDKLHRQKDVQNEEDDEKFFSYTSKHRTGLIKRGGKSGRKRCNDEQKSDPKHKNFTPEEEELVIKLHAAIGSRWPIIAQQLPGRTDNDVKMLWNSKLRKKLSAMGIDPVTHKPFSQILTDYGNIGAFPKARPRFSSLSRDLRHAAFIPSKPEQQSQHGFPNIYDNRFSTPNTTGPKTELSDHRHHSFDLYSQLQAVNLVTEASNYPINNGMQQQCLEAGCFSSSDHSPGSSITKEEISSFSWSDFLLEDVFQPQNTSEEQDMYLGYGVDQNIQETLSPTSVEEKTSPINILMDNFEIGDFSSNGSFVEAMLERQDEVFAQFPQDLYDEVPFY